MLEDSFFTIKSRELSPEKKYMFRISINPSHEVFKGHFEGKPIVPGVMILDIFKECALHCLEGVGNLRLRELSQARFTSLLEPSDSIDSIVSISMAKIDGAVPGAWNFAAALEPDTSSEETRVYATAKGCLEQS